MLLILSCKNSNQKQQGDQFQGIDSVAFPVGANCQNPGSYNYLIQMEEAKVAFLEDILDSTYAVKFTPLEVDDSRNLLGEISKLWDYSDSLIYIADLQIANKVYGFGRDGKMKFVVGEIGEGPGQYKQLWDVQYNQHLKRLELWDYPQHKMLYFDLAGKFISEQKINQEIVSFYPITKDWYIFHMEGRDHLGQKKPLLRYSDITGEKIMKEGAWEYGVVDAWPSKQEFSEYAGGVYFLRAMMDTIFWIGPVNRQICPDYVIDFGDKRIPEEAKKESDLMAAANLIQNNNSSFSTGNLVIGRTYLHFEWIANDIEDKYFHFVDRFQFQSYKIPAQQFSIFGIRIERVNFVSKHDFVGYSVGRNVDKSKLQIALENKHIHPDTKADLQKILDIQDPEMPFTVRFRLMHPETYK
ncbi:6-bladed beta-propeller [Algoriphagus boritolerans]|nr:6-bladed beta-propeller [Algoriphagus boritolerans]